MGKIYPTALVLFCFVNLGCSNLDPAPTTTEIDNSIAHIESTVQTYFQPEVAERCLQAEINVYETARVLLFWGVSGYCHPLTEEVNFTWKSISGGGEKLIIHEFLHFVWFHMDIINKDAFERDLATARRNSTELNKRIEDAFKKRGFFNLLFFEGAEAYAELGEEFIFNPALLPDYLKKHYEPVLIAP